MIKPIKELIVVKPDAQEERTASGIYIPDSSMQKKQMGKVMAVGGDVKEVKVGDRILYGKYSGSEVELEDVTYLIFKEDDVLGVIE